MLAAVFTLDTVRRAAGTLAIEPVILSVEMLAGMLGLGYALTIGPLRRPPARDAESERLRATRVVAALALVLFAAGLAGTVLGYLPPRARDRLRRARQRLPGAPPEARRPGDHRSGGAGLPCVAGPAPPDDRASPRPPRASHAPRAGLARVRRCGSPARWTTSACWGRVRTLGQRLLGADARAGRAQPLRRGRPGLRRSRCGSRTSCPPSFASRSRRTCTRGSASLAACPMPSRAC